MAGIIDEALRYLGAGQNAPDDLRRRVAEISHRLTQTVSPRFTYKVFPILREDRRLTLPCADLILDDASSLRMLKECGRVVLLGCTLGAAFDAMLRTEQIRSMADAVILDACGSALVEAGCDTAEQEIRGRFPDLYLTDRFSPGYGTVPLELQSDLCAALDTPRRLGLHATEHCLLNPTKSVTALIGLSDRPQMARIRGCAYCALRNNCTFRKGGTRCEAE